MPSFRALFRQMQLVLTRDRATRELEEEMRLHRELRAESLEQQGHTPSAARHAAQRRFGNAVQLGERSLEMWGFVTLTDLDQDIRYAARRLRRQPGFTLAVIGVLALGIGATTAIFSAVDAAMLRPLPFPEPQQLVALPQVSVPLRAPPGQEPPPSPNHYLDLTDVRGMPALFQSSAVYAAGGMNLTDPGRALRVKVGVVTTDFFTTLGISAAQGRTFAPAEGLPDDPDVAVISDELWRTQYGSADMAGRTMLLNGKSYQIVGVMPRRFSFPEQSQLWIPMSVPSTTKTFAAFRGYLPSHVIARLAPGVGLATVSAQMLARWQQGFAPPEPGKRYPNIESIMDDLKRSGAVVPLQQTLVGDRRVALLVLLGATGLLLLIACANVTNLLLSQAAARRREIAVRTVLGARSGRMVRQLLTESLMLALGGVVLGVALAPLLLRMLRGMLPAQLNGLAPATLDVRVLAFALVTGLLTGLAFGIWPALGSTRLSHAQIIKSGGGHGSTTGGRANRGRRLLVGLELTLTVMLLTGAGLMLHSFQALLHADRGMNVERVGTLEMVFPASPDWRTARMTTINGVLERLDAMPQVQAAGWVNDLPLGGAGGMGLSVTVDGALPAKNDEANFAHYLIASGGYFDALHIPLLRGRNFSALDDGGNGPPVAIISESMAKSFWPATEAVGRTFHIPNDTLAVTVIGVVPDVRESWEEGTPMPQMYLPIGQRPPSAAALLVRSDLPASQLLAQMTAAVRGVDPSQAVFKVRSMDQVFGDSMADRTSNTLLIAIFAGLALVLAALGTWAVVAYGVAQRSREFGIRAALGATGSDLVSLISREMLWVVVGGATAGMAGAWAFSKVLASLLFGVDTHDPVTFIAVPVLLVLTTLAATALPARRALRVNPADVIRGE